MQPGKPFLVDVSHHNSADKVSPLEATGYMKENFQLSLENQLNLKAQYCGGFVQVLLGTFALQEHWDKGSVVLQTPVHFTLTLSGQSNLQVVKALVLLLPPSIEALSGGVL